MKVLWFTNTPSGADTFVKNEVTSGGWIKSLEQSINQQVDLSIAFYHPQAMEPFTIHGTSYYPIRSTRKGMLGKIRYKLFNEIEPKADLLLFLEIISTVQPDLIHVHGTEGPFGLIQQHTTIPVVISIQGIIAACVDHYYDGISASSVSNYEAFSKKIVRNSYNDHYRRLVKQAFREKEIIDQTQYFLGRTAWDKTMITSMHPHVSYYHQDELLRPAFFQHEWEYHETDSPILFTTTGTNLFKGFETLLQCAALLEQQSISFEWHIAGVSATDEIVQLAIAATGTPLSSSIHFLGKRSEVAMVNSLVSSDLYVGISHIENSPNSLCEAQLIGLPCISTAVGGTPTILTDQVDGMLVNPGDDVAMAEAIIYLLNTPQHAIELAKNARIKARKRHDTAIIVAQLMNAYQHIFATKSTQKTH